MSLVMNEIEYAEELIRNHSLGSKPSEVLGYIAMYYRGKGYNRGEIKGLLEDYMLRCDPDINLVKWQDSIDFQVKRAYKRDLVVVKAVPITKKEFEICNKLSSKRMQRLMFSLICLAKFANMANSQNNNWVNRTDKEIFSTANVALSIKQQSLMLNDLKNLGLIRFSKKVDNLNINVVCLDDNGEVELEIEDLRNLGYQYMRHWEEVYAECTQSSLTAKKAGRNQNTKHRADSYTECASCGLVIKKTGRNQKYCNNCAITVNSQKTYENQLNAPAESA